MAKWYATVDVYAREMFEYEDIEADTEEEAREGALKRGLEDSRLGAEDGDVSELGRVGEDDEENEEGGDDDDAD